MISIRHLTLKHGNQVDCRHHSYLVFLWSLLFIALLVAFFFLLSAMADVLASVYTEIGTLRSRPDRRGASVVCVSSFIVESQKRVEEMMMLWRGVMLI
jgi:hypothetical protein